MTLAGQGRSGSDAGLRKLLDRIAELESQLRMVSAAAAGNRAQLDFLAGQTASAEASPPAFTTITLDGSVDVPDSWVPFDPAADAQVTITTSSTGRVAVQAGGYVIVESVTWPIVYGYVGVEVLAANGTQVRAPQGGDGNTQVVQTYADTTVGSAGAGHRHEWLLAPNTSYTLRCRRGYSVGAGNAGATAIIRFQGTALSVTKLGM